jgi:DNA-binding CsgD family transcriptional regulator
MERDLRGGDPSDFIDNEAASRQLSENGVPCAVRRIITTGAARELAKIQATAALTQAETEVLGWTLLRMTYEEIADARGVSVNTVKSQMKGLLGKLGVARREDLGHALARGRRGRSSVAWSFLIRLEAHSPVSGSP